MKKKERFLLFWHKLYKGISRNVLFIVVSIEQEQELIKKGTLFTVCCPWNPLIEDLPMRGIGNREPFPTTTKSVLVSVPY